MAILGAVIGLRGVVWFTLLAFVPLWVESLGHSKAYGGRLLFLMLLAGAVGTLALGPVADRIGLRRTLVVTQFGVTPLVLTFVYAGGVIGAIALMFVGVCVVGTFGVTMVLSQLYLPRHIGMASGLSVGLAMGIGGVAAVVLGALADAIDLKTALLVSAFAPLAGVVLSLRLPRPRRASWLPRPAPVDYVREAEAEGKERLLRVERYVGLLRPHGVHRRRELERQAPLGPRACEDEVEDGLVRRAEHGEHCSAGVDQLGHHRRTLEVHDEHGRHACGPASRSRRQLRLSKSRCAGVEERLDEVAVPRLVRRVRRDDRKRRPPRARSTTSPSAR